MKWKAIVVTALARRQAGRCADCRGAIEPDGQAVVKYTERGQGTGLDNLKLVHRDCRKALPRRELLQVQIEHLLKRNETSARIAKLLHISERTVWRHKAKR